MKLWQIVLIIWSLPNGWFLLFLYARGERRNGYGEYGPQEIAPRRSLTPGESMRQHCEDEGATTGAGLRTKRPRRSLSLDDEDLAVAAAERWADERGGWRQ